jgi:hypothetical protein
MLLNGNPGLYDKNKTFLLGNECFVQASRANRLHIKQEYPFYHLDPRLAGSPGYDWWRGKRGKLNSLIDLYGAEKVANEVCVIEYFPYHSVKFGHPPFVSSQAYSWHLVKEGLKRNAIIILMRSKDLWFSAVPELEGYQNYYEVNDPRNPTISVKDCPKGFPEIRKVLTNGYLHT